MGDDLCFVGYRLILIGLFALSPLTFKRHSLVVQRPVLVEKPLAIPAEKTCARRTPASLAIGFSLVK